MVDPHILDVLVARHAATAKPVSPVVTARQKSNKKRQNTSDKGRAKGGAAKPAKSLPVVSPSKAVLSDEALRRDLAHATIRCITFYSLGQPSDLVAQSAAFLEALSRLWALRGIDVDAVWREIDHRVQLGNLLNQINREIPASAETTRKYWRPSSTKLP